MSNPSYEVMRRSVERHLTEIERMREFDRGYQAGKQAMDAERHKAVCELRKLNSENFECKQFMGDLLSAIDPEWISKASMYDDATLNEYMRDRLINLLGEDQPSGIDVLRESCKNGDNCKAEANESIQSSKSAKNCKSGHSRTCPESGDEVSESAPSMSITDELRKWASTEVPYKYGHQLHAIATRIEEQFARICQQQEAVLQSTIEDIVDYDDLYAAAASFAGCDECGKYKQRMYQEFEKRVAVEQERDELQAKLDELDVSGATALYKLLKATLGEAKNAADNLIASRESRSKLEDELRRKTAESQGLRHECSTYRDMLLIASDELGSIKKHLDEIAEVLDGRD